MKPDLSRATDYLRHMLGAIREYTGGMSEAEFSSSRLVQDAVIRNIKILGEASRNIELHDPGFAQSHPEIPLRDIYLMRNRVMHGYFSVDLSSFGIPSRTICPLCKNRLSRFTGVWRTNDADYS